jgi:hypothetical protein
LINHPWRQPGSSSLPPGLSYARTLPESDHQEILEVLRWFEENLDAPNRFTRSRRASELSRGICWFRLSAHEHIMKARALARVIDRHGIWVHAISVGPCPVAA